MTPPTNNPSEIKLGLKRAKTLLTAAKWRAHKSTSQALGFDRVAALEECSKHMVEALDIAARHPGLASYIRHELRKVAEIAVGGQGEGVTDAKG